MGHRNLSSRWSCSSWLLLIIFWILFFTRYQFDRKRAFQFESFSFSWWGRLETLLRLFFLRSAIGLFLIELLYPFTNLLIRYESELKIGFITKIVSSFLLDCFFFDLRVIRKKSWPLSFLYKILKLRCITSYSISVESVPTYVKCFKITRFESHFSCPISIFQFFDRNSYNY